MSDVWLSLGLLFALAACFFGLEAAKQKSYANGLSDGITQGREMERKAHLERRRAAGRKAAATRKDRAVS